MTKAELPDPQDVLEGHDAHELHRLYLAHATGQGAQRDTKLARRLLRRAAELGYAVAQNALANEVYGKDNAEALAWFLESAAQGDADGQLSAGRMLFDGAFVEMDAARGHELIKRSAAQGHVGASAELVSVERRMGARARSDGENLARAIAELDLGVLGEPLARVTKPSIRLVTVPSDDAALPIGSSKLGGAPDLPEGAPWPHHASAPLTFVAQLELRQLAPLLEGSPLPSAGLLSFFYDAARETGSVVFHAEGAVVTRASSSAPTFRACRVDAFRELTIPSARTAMARALVAEGVTRAGSTREDAEVLSSKYYDLTTLFRDDYRRPPTRDGEVHRALGHADAIQGDMSRRIVYGRHGVDLDAPTPALEAESRQWQLLLQVDSDPRAAMNWRGGGRLYFWIRDEDLAARRFDDVVAQVQTA